jgi:formylglycine-generating enzyme required for sulfatase activity
MSFIFLSYSHDDGDYARSLAKTLEERGFSVFIDERIDYGTTWPRVIQEKLDDCGAFVVVMSPRSYDSNWVQNELSRAISKKKPLFPLLLEGDDPWLSVQAVQYVDVRGSKLPPTDFYARLASVVAKPRPPEPKEKPLEKEITNSIGMKFVLIPAGTFIRKDDTVTLTKPFYLQSTQVTQGQWKRVMEKNPSHFKDCGDDCPVESVSWHNVQEFLKKLNQMEDTDKYRLPTEAEWEYACRAGSRTAYHFGDNADKLGGYAWYKANSANKTHPVGQKEPNAFGLYDMHGNVWEWCEDWHGDYPTGDVEDPKGPSKSKGGRRVLRGGSWRSSARHIRSAYRHWDYPGDRNYHFGFRVARGL